MNGRPQVFVTNDPHAMRINRDLADEIGFQESVIFLQLEYLIRTTNDPSRVVLRDGKWWYRATLKELSEEQFSWWSQATIHRVLHRLEERSLICVDDTNAIGYDRTQWYAVDPEGVRSLASIAILQNEKCISQNETPIFHSETPILQNETTIQGELVGELKERIPNGIPKKVESTSAEPSPLDVSSPPDPKTSDTPQPEASPGKQAPPKALPRRKRERISAPSADEAERKFSELCERSRHGEALVTLSEIMAEENETGKVSASRVWREIGARYLANRKRYAGVSEEAWAYGFEAAITKGAANIGYVTKAARGYRPQRLAESRRSAVVGVSDTDYDGDPFAQDRAGGEQ